MAIQCTPENIQQMMMALKASFGIVENDRKQVFSLKINLLSQRNLLRLQATAFLQQAQQQPGFSQILLAVISQVRGPSLCIASSRHTRHRLGKRHLTSQAPPLSASKISARSTGPMMTA
jgi:hypothetical protein